MIDLDNPYAGMTNEELERQAKMELVIHGVRQERWRQDNKWGEPKRQSDGTGPNVYPSMSMAMGYDWDPLTYSELEKEAKYAIDQHAAVGKISFADILLEEVFEALATDKSEDLVDELTQVAAVCVKWIEVVERERDSR